MIIASFGACPVMSQNATSVLAQEAKSLKATEFRKVITLNDLPSEVRAELGDMADVGKPFAAGCVGGPGVPHQRLISGFVGNNRCWVAFESGGFAYMHRLALYSHGKEADGKAKVLWSSTTPEAIDTVEALKKFVDEQVSEKRND